jgi:hypothetical protein
MGTGRAGARKLARPMQTGAKLDMARLSPLLGPCLDDWLPRNFQTRLNGFPNPWIVRTLQIGRFPCWQPIDVIRQSGLFFRADDEASRKPRQAGSPQVSSNILSVFIDTAQPDVIATRRTL